MELWKNWWANFNWCVRACALLMISAYRATLTTFFGGACRFHPSCSCYAQQAFETHSPARAFWLTLRRLLKCHPLGPFGFDPVPDATGKHQGKSV